MAFRSSVVVVGGGVFGCATAYQLARRGIQATLIEPDEFGAHASGKNPGNLNPIYGAPSALIPLALKSFARHQVLVAELAELGCVDYDLQPVRRVLLAFNETERGTLAEAEHAFEGKAGFATTRLDPGAVRKLDPRISEGICEALLVDGNRSVDSLLFHRALADGAVKAGVTLVRDLVTGIDTHQGRAHAVRTTRSEFACDAVVFATGPWIAGLRQWLDFDIPVTPVKGEMLRVRLPGAALEFDFTQGMISLYRRGEAECMIGVTREYGGFDEAPSDAGRQHLLEAAARIMPAVAQATILEHSASLRPMTQSGLPIVGLVPGWANAYIANGGCIKGMLLCAGIGLGLAETIVDGDTAIPIHQFKP